MKFWDVRNLIFLGCLCCSVLLMAATNPPLDEIPALRRPRGEIPPGFWEQHGGAVIAGSVVCLALIGIGIWFARRQRPAVVVPDDIEAKNALEPLQNQPENGMLLSRVSQILRRYLSRVASLGPEEKTTSEFCATILKTNSIDPQLLKSMCDFLVQCDERKFGRVAVSEPLDAVRFALRSIDAVEAHLAKERNQTVQR